MEAQDKVINSHNPFEAHVKEGDDMPMAPS